MEDKSKIALQLSFLVVLVASITLNVLLYRYSKQEPSVKRDTVEVVRWDTIHDSLPPVKGEKVTGSVTLRVKKKKEFHNDDDVLFKKNDSLNTSSSDSVESDALILDIIQRKYTDDSTYTAYVSGTRVDSFPRLDSILVRRKIIERTITNTIIKKQHWRFGVGATGGISLTTRKPDIVVGAFVGYTF